MKVRSTPVFTLAEAHRLALEAAVKRKADPLYRPTDDELRAIDHVLVAHARGLKKRRPRGQP